jgi:hypothetical protein
MRIILSLLGYGMILIHSAYAMEYEPKGHLFDPFTHNGQPITDANVASLAPKPSGQLQAVIDASLYRYKEILPALIQTADAVPLTSTDRLKVLQQNAELLAKNGIQVPMRKVTFEGKEYEITRSSFVLPCVEPVDGKEYVMIFSTPAHKRYNLETYNGKGWGTGLTESDKKTHTYQTVSRIVGAFQARRYIQSSGATLYVPHVYAAQVPGRQSIYERASDETTIVIQEKYNPDNVLPLKDNLKKIESLDSKDIESTFNTIKNGVFWDAENSLFIGVNNRLQQHDLQQPNNAHPSLFYYHASKPAEVLANGWTQQDYVEYRKQNDVSAGLQGFASLLKEAAKKGHNVQEQSKEFKRLVENDPVIKSWQNVPKGTEWQVYNRIYNDVKDF